MPVENKIQTEMLGRQKCERLLLILRRLMRSLPSSSLDKPLLVRRTSKNSFASSPDMTIRSTTVLNDEQLRHWTPRKCQALASSDCSQSMQVIFTTRASSGGTGCSLTPVAMAFQVGIILSLVSAVFLQIGHRESWAANCRKHSQCIAWPQGISWEALRELNRNSWQTGQFDLYFPLLQLWLSYKVLSMHIPQSWQCWKFSEPPTLQKPQSGQWYGCSSFPIHRLQILQWYSPNWMLQEGLTHLFLFVIQNEYRSQKEGTNKRR